MEWSQFHELVAAGINTKYQMKTSNIWYRMLMIVVTEDMRCVHIPEKERLVDQMARNCLLSQSVGDTLKLYNNTCVD